MKQKKTIVGTTKLFVLGIFLLLGVSSPAFASKMEYYPVSSWYNSASVVTHIDGNGIEYTDYVATYAEFGAMATAFEASDQIWLLTEATNGTIYGNNNGGNPAWTGISASGTASFTVDGHTIVAKRYTVAQCTGGCSFPTTPSNLEWYENNATAGQRHYGIVVVDSAEANTLISDKDSMYAAMGYIFGCSDPDAENYDPTFNVDDGSCTYPSNPGTTIHPFKYVPQDVNNTEATVSNATEAQDSNDVWYWSKNSGTNLIQSPVEWTTSSYLYVFIEGSSTYAYNQFYVKNTNYNTNLSYYSGSGHNPEKVATFLVDGKYISMYRLYTVSATTTGFELQQATNASNPFRIYGVVPSDGTPSVDDEASMYEYLATFSGSPCTTYDTVTCITQLLPENDSTEASTTVTFTLQVYIDPDDIGTLFSVNISLRNVDFNSIGARFFSDNDIQFLDNFTATSSGYYNFSTTTTLSRGGNYAIDARIVRSYLSGIITNSFALSQQRTHYFTVGSSTFIGRLFSQNNQLLSEAFNQTASTTATTTEAMAGACSLFASGSSVLSCLAFLFVPSASDMQDLATDAKDNVLTHFPLGYVTDFFVILSTTTTSQIYIIDATLPTALGLGDNQRITLNANNVLDFVLNATTTVFNNASASSTDTLFTITNRYWEIICYLGALLYIIRRIIGAQLLPLPMEDDSVTITTVNDTRSTTFVTGPHRHTTSVNKSVTSRDRDKKFKFRKRL